MSRPMKGETTIIRDRGISRLPPSGAPARRVATRGDRPPPNRLVPKRADPTIVRPPPPVQTKPNRALGRFRPLNAGLGHCLISRRTSLGNGRAHNDNQVDRTGPREFGSLTILNISTALLIVSGYQRKVGGEKVCDATALCRVQPDGSSQISRMRVPRSSWHLFCGRAKSPEREATIENSRHEPASSSLKRGGADDQAATHPRNRSPGMAAAVDREPAAGSAPGRLTPPGYPVP
jgi:hypothetical protein